MIYLEALDTFLIRLLDVEPIVLWVGVGVPAFEALTGGSCRVGHQARSKVVLDADGDLGVKPKTLVQQLAISSTACHHNDSQSLILSGL